MIKSAVQNFLVQTLSLVLSFFDRVVVVGLLIRGLGVERYADWVALSSCAGLLSLAETGLNFYFGNALQRAFARRDEAEFQRTLRIAVCSSGALGLVLSLVSVLVIALVDLTKLVTLNALSRSEATLCVTLLAASVISKIIRGGVFQIYRGRQQFARGALIDLVNGVFASASCALVALAGGAPTALAIVYLAADLMFGWGPVLWDVRRRFPFLSLRPAVPSRAEISAAAACVKWSAASQACVTLLLWLPPLILGATTGGGGAVVAFVVLRTLVNLARQAAGMLLLAANVELAAFMHLEQRGSIATRIPELGTFTMVWVSALAVASLFFGEQALALWTGRAGLFEPSVLIWLFAGAFAGALAAPFQTLMAFANEPKAVALAGLLNAAAGLPVAALASMRWGAPGLAFGLAMGEIAACVFTIGWRLPQRLNVNPTHYVVRSLVAAALTAAWCVIVVQAMDALAPGAGALGFGARVAGFGALGALPCAALAIPPQIRRRLLDALVARLRLKASGALVQIKKRLG